MTMFARTALRYRTFHKLQSGVEAVLLDHEQLDTIFVAGRYQFICLFRLVAMGFPLSHGAFSWQQPCRVQGEGHWEYM